MQRVLYSDNDLDTHDKDKNLTETQHQDFFPYKSSRNHYQVSTEQQDNFSNVDDKNRLFTITSPLSTMRFGDEQRKILLDGKKNMDNFAYKFVNDDSGCVQSDMDEGQLGKKNSSMNFQALNKCDLQNIGLDMYNIEDIQSSGGLQNQNEQFKNNIFEFSNHSMSKQKRYNQKRNKSLFVESQGNEIQRYDDVKSLKSRQLTSQLDTQQIMISPTKHFANNQKYLTTLTAQNSFSQSNARSIKNNNLGNVSIAMDLVTHDQNSNNNNKRNSSKIEKSGFRGVWREKSLIIIYFARKFLVDVKKYSSTWRFKNLTYKQFQTINDVSSDEKEFYNKCKNNQKNNRSCLSQCISSICTNQRLSNCIMQNFITIRPDSAFKLLWDCIILILLFINIFYIPVNLCFTGVHKLQLNYILEMFLSDVPGWAFLADALVRSNTAFYQKGQLITQKSKILIHYYRQSFFLDLVILIPFIISMKFTIQFLDVIFLLRINRLIDIISNFEQQLNLSQKRNTIFGLARLALTIIFVAHFCGCFFFYVGTLDMTGHETVYQVSWVEKQFVANQTFQDKYTTCLYWATITMITVGYGDITPLRTIEKQTVLAITILSCGVYAYSINVIGIILQELRKEKQILKNKLSVLSSYMKKRGISHFYQEQIKKYFNYMHEEDLKFNEGGDIFFNEVKGQLKTDILSEIYYKILYQSKLFRMNFSQNFLENLSLVMEEQKYVCDEIIMNIGDECNNLYFISRGMFYIKREVQSLIDGGQVIGNHNKGTIFDEISFFSEGKSDLQYKSIGITTIVYVKKENFVKLLKIYPKDYEKYCMMRDKIILYRNLRNFEHRCKLCLSFKHTLRECLFVNPLFNKDKILYQHNKIILQDRDPTFIRRRQVQSLRDFKENIREVRDTVIQYIIDSNPFEESPNGLLNLVQFMIEYDNHEINLYKDKNSIVPIQPVPEYQKQVTNTDIHSNKMKKISLSNLQELDNEQSLLQSMQNRDDSPFRNKLRQLQTRQKGSSIASQNNEQNQQQSSQPVVSQTPISMQQPSHMSSLGLQNKNQAFSEATQQIFNINLHSIPLENSNHLKKIINQQQRMKQPDDISEQTFQFNVHDYFLQHQQTLAAIQDKQVQMQIDGMSSVAAKKKTNSFSSLNSQKVFLKQSSKNSNFVNENQQNQQSQQNNNQQNHLGLQNIYYPRLSNFQEISAHMMDGSFAKQQKNHNHEVKLLNNKKKFMVLEDFDKLFYYSIYFPESNLDKVLLDHLKKRKTVDRIRKVQDQRAQEDRLKQIRKRSKQRYPTRTFRVSSHNINYTYASMNQINAEDQNLDNVIKEED